jgi:hypothetical protein
LPSSLAAPLSFCPLPSCLRQRSKIQPLPIMARLLTPSVRLCHAFCRKDKRQKARQSLSARTTASRPRASCFTWQASVVLADGSRLSRVQSANRSVPPLFAACTLPFLPQALFPWFPL